MEEHVAVVCPVVWICCISKALVVEVIPLFHAFFGYHISDFNDGAFFIWSSRILEVKS
jgi:hypothetical protein